MQRDPDRDHRLANRLYAQKVRKLQRVIARSDAPLDVKVTVDLQATLLLALLRLSRKALLTAMRE